MAFRRPRVHVKPNVSASRPATNAARSSETSTPLDSTVRDEPSTESVPVSSVVEESNPPIDEPVKVPTPPPPAVVESPSAPVVEPSPSPPFIAPIPVEPSFSAPIAVEPIPSPATAPTTVRPVFRRRPAPNLGARTATHHRRPSASCSGTESETESVRQKHSTASSISYTRILPAAPTKTVPHVEAPSSSTTDPPMIDEAESSTVTKMEMISNETVDVPTSSTEVSSSQTPTTSSRTTNKISREYLIQHITYRAQRLAHKVEAEKTTRRRRAATLGKIERANANRDGPIDTSKLTIADFAHYNPTDNPMEPKAKTTTIIEATENPVRKQSFSGNEGQPVTIAPQLKVDANGSLVIDEESLYIRQVDETPRTTVIIDGQFNDDNLTHRSYRKIGRRKRWSNRDTLRFYQALRMCGTDFTLIANVFPNRNRDDIKRKFKTEDKANRTLIDAALNQRIPFDLTCFFSPSEESSNEENGSDVENLHQKKTRKRRRVKSKPTSTSDPLEINRRRERRLQKKNPSFRVKKSAEFIDDDEDDDEEDEEDERSMDVADTVEVVTSNAESKLEQSIPTSHEQDNNPGDTSMTNIAELENLLGRIDGGHLLFVHNTDEATGVERIDVHVVMSNDPSTVQEQSL